MSQRRPAWSGQFTSDALQMLAPVAHLDDITPDWAWGGSTGQGVKVAVLDSGVEASHPGIGGPVNGYVAISEGPDGFQYDPAPHEDSYGHGTACVGIIRAVAPEGSAASTP